MFNRFRQGVFYRKLNFILIVNNVPTYKELYFSAKGVFSDYYILLRSSDTAIYRYVSIVNLEMIYSHTGMGPKMGGL